MRCYSMSSAPAIDDRLAVTVKRVPGGVMSNWLHDHVAAGDELEMMPPAGVFCEHPGDDGPIVAFCGGSGVTPVFSIVKQALHRGTRPVRLFYANRDEASVIFSAAIDELAAAHPDRLTVHHHLDAQTGYVSADDITSFLADTGGDRRPRLHLWPDPVHGPRRGGRRRRRRSDRSDRHRTLLELGDRSPAGDRGRRTRSDDEPSADAAPTQLTITIKRKRHVLEHVPGDTVLDAARRASLNPPYSCEQGNCATCMALVTDGSVTMRVNNALTPDEVAEGWVLTCQSLPLGPEVAIEYDDL